MKSLVISHQRLIVAFRSQRSHERTISASRWLKVNFCELPTQDQHEFFRVIDTLRTFLRHNLSLTPRPGNCRTEIFPMICQSLRGKRSCNTGGSRLNKMIPIRKRYVISIYSKKTRFLNHVRPISVKWEKLQRFPHLAPFARPHCQRFLDEHSNHPTARTTPNTREYNLTIQNTQLV